VKQQTIAILADDTIPEACITDMRCKALIQAGIDYQFVDGTVTFTEQYKLPLQIQPQSNAAAGLVAFHQLYADRLSTSVVDSANQNLQLKGRYQVLCESPLTILDVAHNPQAIDHLVTQLQQRNVQNIHAIIGMMHDKNLSEVIRILKNSVMHWHFCDLDSPRAATARQLSTVAEAQGISLSDISCYSSPTEANDAVSHHVHPSEDSIIIIGSFLTVGPIIEQANL
jgi:dihydrofolate synthase/folylpolyglutamate synthase